MFLRIDRCETGDGNVFDPYVIECSTWVNVIALTKQREVVLVNQYRHGAKQVMLEIPAGMMDDEDESPLYAAQRELLEETGYTSDRFIKIGRVYPNPATHNNLTYSFLTLDAEQVAQQRLDDTEEIEVTGKRRRFATIPAHLCAVLRDGLPGTQSLSYGIFRFS